MNDEPPPTQPTQEPAPEQPTQPAQTPPALAWYGKRAQARADARAQAQAQGPATPAPPRKIQPWMWVVGAVLAAVLVCCCGGTALLALSNGGTSTTTSASASTSHQAVSSTQAALPTATPAVTATPAPTATPTIAPTATPMPSRQQLAQQIVDRALGDGRSWPFALDIKGRTVKANSDKSIVVTILVGEGFDSDQIKSDIHAITYDVERGLWQSGAMAITRVDVLINGPVVDKYGKTSTGKYSGATLSYDTATLFAWENLTPDQAWDDYDAALQYAS